jgi:hypothetical protein
MTQVSNHVALFKVNSLEYNKILSSTVNKKMKLIFISRIKRGRSLKDNFTQQGKAVRNKILWTG